MSKPDTQRLSPAQTAWLLATAAIVIAPLTLHVHIWIAAVTGLLLLWRGLLAWRGQALPSRWLLLPLTLASAVAILWQFGTLFGQNPGVALLMVFIALKQLEARTTRDGRAVILLAYFLAMAQFFYSQVIGAALASGASVLVTTAALLSLAEAQASIQELLRRAGLMLIQSLPVMLLLFVLFPRVQGPLWALPRDAASGTTGMSDTMSPGSISNLSQSDAIAFRARFDGTMPPRAQLYWRGPVLTDFDGKTWRPREERPRLRLPYPEPTGAPISYELILEPHNRHWLFALEMPGTAPDDVVATRDALLLTKQVVDTRLKFSLRAYPDFRPGQGEDEASLWRSRTLPPGSNPRLRALAAQWRTQTDNDAQLLALAQAYFRQQGLMYTLSPPLLGEHGADEFLFDTKQGFCEHFANAFAVAMRAAGVPARVVTGYQGGEINPVDGWLTVRQYDAHAWTEVWLTEHGWVRIDPTAISAPTRIDLNLAAAVPAGDPLPFLMRADLSWLKQLRFQWDAVTNTWNQWVLGYNPERQREFLRRLGMQQPDWQHMISTLTVLAGLALLGLAAWILHRRQRQDRALRLWNTLSRRMGKHGLARRPHEGPHDYAMRLAAAFPTAADELELMASLYVRARYGRGDGHLIDELARRVASFRP